MTINALFAFLHFIAAFGVVVTVVYERITFGRELSLQDARRIQKADAIYGLSSVLVLVVGFLRVFYFEKGSGYYFTNLFFWTKIGAFVVVGLLSIYPTIRFLKWNKEVKQGQPPNISDEEYGRINSMINLELLGLFIMILSASLMAKGIGF